MAEKEVQIIDSEPHEGPEREQEQPLIYARMSAVMAEIGAIAKDQTNQQQRFNYRGIDDIYNALHAVMAKHQIFTTSEILEIAREDRPTKSGGKLWFSIVKIRYRFHTIDGSSIDTEIIGEGMDSADKATNKAFAIAHKYALLQAFLIPTKEQKDPDAESPDIEWITSEQAADLQSLADEVGANMPLFLRYMKAQSLERIQSCDYKRAVAALESKRKK